MKTQRKEISKFGSKLQTLKSLLSGIIYCILLFHAISPEEIHTIEWLYLEVYNAILIYIIINMLFFAKDIVYPKIDLNFSKQLVQIVLIITSAVVVIIALYILRDTGYHELKTGHTLIKINIGLVIVLSLYFFRKNRRRTPILINK